MDAQAKLDAIPRGNTCPGVNRAVIEYLLFLKEDLAGKSVLDVPCGRGEFLKIIKTFFPGCHSFGADISLSDDRSDHVLIEADLSDDKPLDFETNFSIVTSISGVMEFDNTLNFFRKVRERIDESGIFIVTNDNLLSARDRVLYFLTGRLRQYPLFAENDSPTWKILPLQNLLRVLYDAGFDATEIKYVPAKWTEWLWLPIALPIYLFQNLAFAIEKKGPRYSKKAERYPFASLFSRHYFLVCRPVGQPKRTTSRSSEYPQATQICAPAKSPQPSRS
jgi:SAM-dependent methyltransferase